MTSTAELMYGKHHDDCLDRRSTRRLYARKNNGTKQTFVTSGVVCTSCGSVFLDEKWRQDNRSMHAKLGYRRYSVEEEERYFLMKQGERLVNH